MTPKEKLQYAVTLLNEVRSTLNENGAACPCCGLVKKENWSEAQLAERLRAHAAKIERVAVLLPV
jgi:arsenate reductase-like glutaredoxin family protein